MKKRIVIIVIILMICSIFLLNKNSVMSTIKNAVTATNAQYKGTVTIYGTPESAIKSGPTYDSKVKIDLGTRVGLSWNNVPYTIPQVNEYFELNDGWVLDFVSVAGQSSGNRQPGGTFKLGMSGGSMIYYFKQGPKTFTLNYVANGGSGAPTTQSQSSTSPSYSFTISTTQPTRHGYSFLGWSTDSNASFPTYYVGDTINVTGTKTLYAVWKAEEKVTLKYIDRGAEYQEEPYTEGTNATVIVCTNTRKNYIFAGWSKNQNATTIDYLPGDAIMMDENIVYMLFG